MPAAPAPEPFAALLRRHRLAAGLTQEELSERAGLSARGFAYLERGGRLPYRDTVRRLADALRLDGADRAQFEAMGRRLPRAEVPTVQGSVVVTTEVMTTHGEGVEGAWIYLAHAQADRLIVERLRADLQRRGLTTWIDDQDLLPGTPSWEQALRDAIRAASALLLIASPGTRSSRYIGDELRIAELYGRRVIPVWVAGEQWIECVPLGWGGLQYLDARGDRYGVMLTDLVRLASGLAATPAPCAPLTSSRPGSGMSEAQVSPAEPRNPYKGLRPFTGADAGDFFGREALIASLVSTLTAQVADAPRFLALIGASGSGKSSVLLAGLLPRMQGGAIPGSEAWIYLPPLVPGTRPLTMLAQSLAAAQPGVDPAALRDTLDAEPDALLRLIDKLASGDGQRVVLTVDQFEELFSPSVEEQERRHYIDLLVTAASVPGGTTLLLLTMRADFYDRPLQYPALGALLQTHGVVVLPPAIEDLRQAIEGPAALPDVGLSFDEDLVGDLLFDLRGQPGTLPLLQFALDQLFARREGLRLMGAAYRALGGVRGALARHAEATYAALTDEEQRRLARALFLRLIDPGQMEQDTTRRRAALAELVLPDQEQTQHLRAVTDAFVAARLLVMSSTGAAARGGQETTVEVSHEALIREWDRLGGWLREARDDIRRQHAISADAATWEQLERPADRLYRGTHLQEALAWATRNTPSAQETAFLAAAQVDEERRRGEELAAARALAHAEQRRARVARTLSAVLSLVLVAALVATGVAVRQTRDAQAQRRQADQQRQQAQVARGRALADRNAALKADTALRAQEQVTRNAQSHDLATAAMERLHDNPELSVLLASSAVRLAPSSEATGALTQALAATDPLQATLPGQTSTVFAVTFSPDGRRLVTAGGDATARIWNTSANTLLAVLRGHTDTINAVACSPDGSLIATASDDGTARLWRAQGGRPLAVLHGDTAAVTRVAFSAGGRVLLTAGVDGTARLWEAATGRLLYTIHHDGAADVVALHPSGALIATSGEHDTAQLWDLRSGRATALPMGNSGWVGALGFDRAGDRLLAVTYQGDAAIWAVPSGRLLVRLRAVGGSLDGAFSPDGRRVVTADRDGFARIFSAATGRLLTTLGGSALALRQASFTADGAGVLTLSDDGTARLWDAGSGQPLLNFSHQGTAVEAVALSPRGDLVATGSADGAARVWATQSEVQTLRDPDSAVWWAAFDASTPPKVITFPVDVPLIRIWDRRGSTLASTIRLPGLPLTVNVSDDGRLIGIVARDGSISIWRTDSGKTGLPSMRYTINVGSNGLTFSHDGTLMLSGSQDSPARILQTSTGTLVSYLSVSGGWSSQLFSPDDRSIALATNQGVLGLWDVRTGSLQRTLLPGDNSGAYANVLAFSPGSSLIVAAGSNPAYVPGVARIWQTRTGKLVATLRGHAGGINEVAFSPDGTLLVTASVDHTAKVWDVRTARLITTLSGPTAAMTMALFSPDGTWIAGASADRTVRVWNARSGAQVEDYSGFGGDVNGIVWSRDGGAILASSQDHTTRILSYPLPRSVPQLLALAKQRVGRSLTAVERATYVYGAPGN